ncbi:hypothetical protein SAMN06297387_13034 [Streptomyces zhaozhouensis]|uniref:Phage tail protein (Tail_P2_I) n=1 Tax=Streptomyces zhaozhouensis TaxID=1300267 RepID=A0A286E907_9ACTN|nr:hypothetical protein [Streptomyces zhaozhouensis]SOD67370.1 hypothetical protein SAMN06297387_13034 [Streptomyces zhaozhouensis]
MTREPDALAELLPRWHRLRDAEHGEPLRALLAVIAEQADLIRTGVEQNHRDLFVETAAPWALPYLGELVGYRPLPGYERLPASHEALSDASRRRLAEALAPRRDVAATLGYRRRKGTLPLLEELADSVAGWPARAVELSRLVAHHQPVRLHTPATSAERAARGRLPDLRDGAALGLAGTPFDELPRTVDVRRAASRHRAGGHAPTGVGLHVWRLRPHSVTRAPAYCVDRARNLYTFSVLGNDTPLVTRPEPEVSAAHLATLDHVPAFVRRRQLADRPLDYYGPGKSLTIWRDGRPEPVEADELVVADLSDWRYRARRGQVVVDPELGRIAFGARTAPRHGVWVSYHHALADDLGGGEYPRVRHDTPDATRYPVGPGQPHQRVMDAFARWREDRGAGRCGPEAIIEITDSGAYQEQFDLDLEPGDRLHLRAAEGTRPVLRLLDWYSNRPDALNIHADDGCPPGEAPHVTLDGLLVTGRGIHVSGPLGSLTVRHCTLVPGWSLEAGCAPHHPEEPSLVLERTTARVDIARSVLGAIQVIGDEVGTDPPPLRISDSVLDATAHHLPALAAPDCRHAHAVLHLRRTTVIGEIHAHAVRVAENSLLTGRLHVARRQVGHLRFCYVPPGSRTPRRFRCLPESADRPVRPWFASERYGTPYYARLADGGPEEIRRGADDGAELGVFHDLFEPQREDNLWSRLADHTPAGTDAGILFAT